MNREELHDRVDTIVIVMLENRSFDHLLGALSQSQFGGRADIDGVKSLFEPNHANPARSGSLIFPFIMRDGPLTNDLPHERDFASIQLAHSAITGQPSMSGFVRAYERATGTTAVVDPPSMGLLTPRDLPTTSFLAREYAVCDRWFAPIPSSALPNRLMSLSGFTGWDTTVSGHLPNQETFLQWLDAHHVRWRVYSAGVSFFSLIPRMQPELTSDRFRQLRALASDFVNEPGATRPDVLVIEPAYDFLPIHLSGHAGDNHVRSPMASREAFIREVYEALTSNPGRWQRTVLIVTYDNHGGFYDHVPPLEVHCPPPPGANYHPFSTTGMRVPTIVASPLVQRGVAKHANLDHTSILALLAERFGQPGEAYSQAVAARSAAGIASVSAVLDSGPPRTDIPHIPALAIAAPAAHRPSIEPGGATKSGESGQLASDSESRVREPESNAAAPSHEKARRSVFIGYKREDHSRVRAIAERLNRDLQPLGVEIWWDTKILPGQKWRDLLETQLNAADVVVVLWSSTSIRSSWVIGEAAEGARMAKLVPALLDNVQPPLEFRGIECAELFRKEEAEFNTLIQGILLLLDRTRPPATRGTQRKRRPLIVIIAAAALLAACGVTAYVVTRSRATEPTVSVTSSTPAPPPPPKQAASPDVVFEVLNELPDNRVLKPSVDAVVRAVNIQLAKDFSLYWHRSAELRSSTPTVARLVKEHDAQRGDARVDGATITLRSKGVPGMSRFHEIAGTIPRVVIGVDEVEAEGEVWSAGVSHEVMEALADMDNTVHVSGTLPDSPSKTVLITHEICNPVSAETYPVKLPDTAETVQVSNFVYPSYFDENTEQNEQVDFLGTLCAGKLLRPLGVNPGGYLVYKLSTSDNDWKLWSSKKKCAGRATTRVLP